MSFWDDVSHAIGTDSSNGGIGKIGKELTNNPIVNAALVAAGSIYGGPAGAAAANAAISRAQGNDWNQVASNAAGAGLGSYLAGMYNPALSGGGSLSNAGAAINPFSSAPNMNMPLATGGQLGANGVVSSGGTAGASWIPGVSNGTTLAMGANALNGILGYSAASRAAGAQSDAANRATDLQRDMYESNLVLQEPFRQAGLTGQNRLMEVLGLGGDKNAAGYGSANAKFGDKPFTEDPSYQWRLQQGQQALDRSASARGGLFSGRAGKDMTNYAQGAASQEYGNAFNRFQTERANTLNPLQSLSGVGQTAANTIGQAGQNYATNAGQTMMQAGNANASGYMGGANAISGALSGGLNYMQNQDLINRRYPQYGG